MRKQASDLNRRKEDATRQPVAAKKGVLDQKKGAKTKSGQSLSDEMPKLSPAEVWKNASKMINIKKKEIEQTKKDEACKRHEIEGMKERLEKWSARKRDELAKAGVDANEHSRAQMENALNFYDDEHDFRKEPRPLLPFDAPDFFPKAALCVFECPDVYKKLDIDTLFYVFYTERNTFHQYFATKVLKSRSWRFHTKYNTWFQRLEEPKYITEDYEQGAYMFFDYDTTWTIRKKTDFTFEYKYLENTEL